MTKTKTIGLFIGMLAALGFVASLYFRQLEGEPAINLNPYRALGARAAEETANLLGKQGTVVVILNDPGETRDPVMDAQLESFQETLQRHGNIAITASERVKLDALQSMATGGAIPRDQFLGILQRHPKADAFLLFIGFPQLVDRDVVVLKQRAAKFIAVTAYLPGYKRLLESGVIHLAIVPRFGSLPEMAEKPRTLREWFDQEYVVITPNKTASLPY